MVKMRCYSAAICAAFLFSVYMVDYMVVGHGRLLEPPSRSSMWRYGYKTPPNYNDMELFCGGFTRQWQRNGGKCGICGDPWDAPDPKANEVGGKYARGIVVKYYQQGQTINVTVQLTANHKGHFEFRICSADVDSTVEVTQECLDQNQLSMTDGSGNRYYLPAGSGNGFFNIDLQLPANLHCSRCVFQWIYICGNNWGRCEDGSGRVGCGPQEQFRGCADISVAPSDYIASTGDTPLSTSTTAFTTTTSQTPNYHWSPAKKPFFPHVTTTATTPTTTTPFTTTTTTTTPAPTTVSIVYGCTGAGLWRTAPGMDRWCTRNCLYHYPPFCPPTHCACHF